MPEGRLSVVHALTVFIVRQLRASVEIGGVLIVNICNRYRNEFCFVVMFCYAVQLRRKSIDDRSPRSRDNDKKAIF